VAVRPRTWIRDDARQHATLKRCDRRRNEAQQPKVFLLRALLSTHRALASTDNRRYDFGFCRRIARDRAGDPASGSLEP
jgi:hypothetical protein